MQEKNVVENDDAVLIEQFVQQCRNSNLKVTPQRLAIYKAIAHLKTHPSADQVFRIIKTEHPTISFDTVNRTLNTFAEIGVLSIIESYSGARRFDPNSSQHHHVHCIRCGKTQDFELPDFEQLEIPEQLISGYSVLHKRISLAGICKACREKEEELS